MNPMRPLLALLVLSLSLNSLRAADHGALPTNAPACIELRDQYDAAHRLSFPNTNFVVLTIADRKGSEEIDGWITALKQRYEGRIELRGIADVGGVPGFLQGRIRKKFREARPHPVMMDWSGKVCTQLGYAPDVANILVLGHDGLIHGRFTGPAVDPNRQKAFALLDKALPSMAARGATGSPVGIVGQAPR